MLILTIRTDKPEAEIGLFDGKSELAYVKWEAHRQLAETLHAKIRDLLKTQTKDWSDIQAVVCFKGPGSFTGLRIGITVGNAIAANLTVPIVGAAGKDWAQEGIAKLLENKGQKIVVPDYGREAHITQQKK
jgi:tRNA threonylcarbamoyladenosine biosynthesis protein TsaB